MPPTNKQDRRGRGYYIPPTKIKKIITCVSQEYSIREIANAANCSVGSAHRYKKMLEETGNIAVRERFGKQILPDKFEHAVAKLIKSMRQKGISVSDIEIRKIAFKVATRATAHGVRPELFRSWVSNEIAGTEWLKGFLRRNKRLLDENSTMRDDTDRNDGDQSTREGTVVSGVRSEDSQNVSSAESEDEEDDAGVKIRAVPTPRPKSKVYRDWAILSELTKLIAQVSRAGGRVSKSCLAIIGTHVFGKSCSMDWVESIIEQHPLLAQFLHDFDERNHQPSFTSRDMRSYRYKQAPSVAVENDMEELPRNPASSPSPSIIPLAARDQVLVDEIIQVVMNVQQAGGRVSKACILKIGTKVFGKPCSMDWVDDMLEGYPQLGEVMTDLEDDSDLEGACIVKDVKRHDDKTTHSLPVENDRHVDQTSVAIGHDQVLVRKMVQIFINMSQKGGRASKWCILEVGTKLFGNTCSLAWVDAVLKDFPQLAQILKDFDDSESEA